MGQVRYYERMIAIGDGERFGYLNGAPEFDREVATLRNKFPEYDSTNWFSITTPQYNSIYNTYVVSAVMNPRPAYLDEFDPVVAAIKFFPEKRWVYNKVYTFVNPNERPFPIPDGALPVSIGFLVQVYGQPSGEDLSRYRCLYFQHPIHAKVEAWAKKSLPQGRYSTYYSATFDTKDGDALKRIKVYCYEEQNGASDWEVAWNQTAAARGVLGDYLGSN